ncbi:MAG TPA: hypothetical protein VF407_25220 [Polyangiaceae bacterium]
MSGDNYDDDEVTPVTGPPSFRSTLPFGPPPPTPPVLTLDTQPFAFAPSFHPVEDTGSFKPGDFEAEYEQLYSEALSEGDISDEERQRLDMAASALGMPAERLKRLEEALRKAYDKRASITLTEEDEAATPHPGTLADRAPPSIRPGEISGLKTIPPAEGSSPQTIPPSRSSVLPAPTLPPKRDSMHPSMRAPMPAIPPEDDGSPTRPNQLPTLDLPTDKALDRYLRQPRTETDDLHDRFLEMGHRGAKDEQLGVAAVLARRNMATTAEREVAQAHKAVGLQRPAQPLTTDAWKLLYHPDQDRTTGEIFSVIASAVLLARVTAMRKQKILPKLDPAKKHDPATSTVSVVRALGWSAATLGMTAPPIYVAPESKGGLEIIPQVPPAIRVGGGILSGSSALELAFQCARHLVWFREEYFICSLVPAVAQLEDIFLAALLIGKPDLPMRPDVKARATLNRDAMLPVLEQKQVTRLEELVGEFIARGGRTSLRKWAQSAELTACRAGMLMCGDLDVAAKILSKEPNGEERLADVEKFWASDVASELRRALGVAIG